MSFLTREVCVCIFIKSSEESQHTFNLSRIDIVNAFQFDIVLLYFLFSFKNSLVLLTDKFL